MDGGGVGGARAGAGGRATRGVGGDEGGGLLVGLGLGGGVRWGVLGGGSLRGDAGLGGRGGAWVGWGHRAVGSVCAVAVTGFALTCSGRFGGRWVFIVVIGIEIEMMGPGRRISRSGCGFLPLGGHVAVQARGARRERSSVRTDGWLRRG